MTWGIWLPDKGPLDRPSGAWLRAEDRVGGVACAIVFRSREDAAIALEEQRKRYQLPWDAEPREFAWSAEPSDEETR